MTGARIAAILILLLAQPAAAQTNLLGGGVDKPVTRDDVEKKEAREKAYRDSLKKIPEQKAPNDPWGDVRNAGAPASGKPQQKTR